MAARYYSLPSGNQLSDSNDEDSFKNNVEQIDDNSVVYRITDTGKTALENIDNPYKNRLMILMAQNIKQLSKLSDKRIEELILDKSKKHIKGGIVNEAKVKT